FRDSRVRPNRSLYVAFDRDRFTEVRDTNLGFVRGQPIAVNLAGFGDSFTDWLFQSATHAKQNSSAFSLKAADSWKLGPGWVAVYCMRYLGSGRRLLVPDELLGILAPESDAKDCYFIPVADLFSLVVNASSTKSITSVDESLPDLSKTESIARKILK